VSTANRAVVVSTIIKRTAADVWADVRNIESHVTWTRDATEIRFLSEHHEGPGIRFECDSWVGPLSLTDVIEITTWEDERRMGVRHVGLVELTEEGLHSMRRPNTAEYVPPTPPQQHTGGVSDV
jgi:hypothetical protein